MALQHQLKLVRFKTDIGAFYRLVHPTKFGVSCKPVWSEPTEAWMRCFASCAASSITLNREDLAFGRLRLVHPTNLRWPASPSASKQRKPEWRCFASCTEVDIKENLHGSGEATGVRPNKSSSVHQVRGTAQSKASHP